jgi:hypothetical protein
MTGAIPHPENEDDREEPKQELPGECGEEHTAL